jgi:hypothetical protein
MFENNQTFDQFLKDYYAIGPRNYYNYLGRVSGMSKEEIMEDNELKKILTYDESNYYDPGYSMDVQLQFATFSELYKILDKRPITEVGLSYDYATSMGLSTVAIQPGGATTIFDGSETETGISQIQNIASPVMGVDLARSLTNWIHEGVPGVIRKGGEPNWDFIKNKMAPMTLYNEIDKWLGGLDTATNVDGVDTPSTTHIEMIDRMITSSAESGATDHVSANTDGDIFWNGVGSGSAKIDRSGVTWADAQVKLPTTPGTEESYEILEEVDTLMRTAKRYSTNKRYAGFTTGATFKKMANEYGGTLNSLETEVQVSIGINGLETGPGHTIGFPVQAIWTNNIKVPIFVSETLPLENSVYTTDTSGHLYIIDLDEMFVRVDMPMTFLETGFGVEMLHQNYLRSRGLLFIKQNLMATKFACHAAVKWIKA